jgi:hypothetical protein
MGGRRNRAVRAISAFWQGASAQGFIFAFLKPRRGRGYLALQQPRLGLLDYHFLRVPLKKNQRNMIVITKDVKDYMFSSALDSFEFTTNQESVNITIECGDETILEESYVPDSDSKVILYDLQRLFEPYLSEKLVETFKITLDDGASETVRSIKVQYCAAETWVDAESFMTNNYLTTLQGYKITAIGFREFVHFYLTETSEMDVYAVYYDPNSMDLFEKTVNTKTITTTGKVLTEEVSSAQYQMEGYDLISYRIVIGERFQKFEVMEVTPDAAPALVFTNSFGCQETIYCTGTHSLEPELTRSTGYLSGMFRSYDIEENKVFKANTGSMTHEMANWADDLLRSKEIYLLDGDTIGKEITITESESKRNNDDDNRPVYTFSYRYAQRNHNILSEAKAGRIFDNTFDYTFG